MKDRVKAYLEGGVVGALVAGIFVAGTVFFELPPQVLDIGDSISDGEIQKICDEWNDNGDNDDADADAPEGEE